MVIEILEQHVWDFLQACATLLILLNTQRISGKNWIEPLASTMRIIIEIWRAHPAPQGFFIQKSRKECLASFEPIQGGDAGVMDPEKLYMSRGKDLF